MLKRADVPALESHLGYWLRIVSNAVSQSFARRVEANGVTVAEWVFMRVLYDVDRLPPTLLAERMGMTKGAITKLAQRLIEKELVARVANSNDRRAQTLALTTAGRSLVPQLAKIADENDAEFFADLGLRTRADLEKILRRIVDRRGLKDMPTN